MNKQDFIAEHYTDGRPYGIKNIIIHHMGGILTASACANILNNRGVSAHYCIGSDNIVGTLVEENKRAWHAGDGIGVGSKGNDKGIGIEVSNDSVGGDWHVSDTQFNTLIELVRDIAVRNNLLPLVVGGNLFGHRDCVATTCPGNYLYSKLGELANRVNNYSTKVQATADEIKQAYLDILERQYDEGGLQTYLNADMTIEEVRNALETSPEHATLIANKAAAEQARLAQIEADKIAAEKAQKESEAKLEATEEPKNDETTNDSIAIEKPVTNDDTTSDSTNTNILVTIFNAIINFIKSLFNKENK